MDLLTWRLVYRVFDVFAWVNLLPKGTRNPGDSGQKSQTMGPKRGYRLWFGISSLGWAIWGGWNE